MSYANAEQQRSYQREYKRLKRAGSCQTPGQSQLPAEFRLRTAEDVLDLLAEQVEMIRQDKEVATTERARAIGYLCGIALRAVEVADLADRLESMERAFKERKEGAQCGTQWQAVSMNG